MGLGMGMGMRNDRMDNRKEKALNLYLLSIILPSHSLLTPLGHGLGWGQSTLSSSNPHSSFMGWDGVNLPSLLRTLSLFFLGMLRFFLLESDEP